MSADANIALIRRVIEDVDNEGNHSVVDDRFAPVCTIPDVPPPLPPVLQTSNSR